MTSLNSSDNGNFPCQQYKSPQEAQVHLDDAFSTHKNCEDLQDLETPLNIYNLHQYYKVSAEELIQVVVSVETETSVQFSDILEDDVKRECFYKLARRVFGMEEKACCSIGKEVFPYCRIVKEEHNVYSGTSDDIKCRKVSIESLSLVADCVRAFYS